MWLYLIVGLVMVFLLTPILVVIPLSFSASRFLKFPPDELSLAWYNNFFSNSSWGEATIYSLLVAVPSMILALILGTAAALAVSHFEFRGKNIFMALMMAPILVPVIIVAVSAYRFYSEIHIASSFISLVLSHALLAIPIVFITVLASLKGFNRNIELAASGLGTTPIGVFYRIILPNIKPALFSSSLFAFMISFDEVVVTIFISSASYPTLPVFMWEQMNSSIDPTLAASSTIIIILTILIFKLQSWYERRSKKKFI